MSQYSTKFTEGKVEQRSEHNDFAWSCGVDERLIYHYATDQHKAYFHPVRTTNGETLTAFEPDDHPWHRGIWFAWKYLNGANFWEEAADGTQEGYTEFAGIKHVTYQSKHTQILLSYNYSISQGCPLLREQRKLDIQFPSQDMCIIDWDATFTAGIQPVTLDRTLITPQTPWGGYAGLSFRAAPTWSNVQGIDSEGRRNLAIKNKRARWVQMTGQITNGHSASVAIFDHPANPRHPTY